MTSAMLCACGGEKVKHCMTAAVVKEPPLGAELAGMPRGTTNTGDDGDVFAFLNHSVPVSSPVCRNPACRTDFRRFASAVVRAG